MNKYTQFFAVFKQVLTKEEIQTVIGQTKDYVETGTKMTVGLLFDYFVQASCHGWKSFRQSANMKF